MIKYFFINFFHKRNKIFLLLTFVLVVIATFFTSFPFSSKAEVYLNLNILDYDYKIKIVLVAKIITLFSVSLILIDHDKAFIKPLIVYFGRLKIALYKLLFYIVATVSINLINLAIIVAIPFLVTPYFKASPDFILNYIKTISDSLILTILLLTFIRKNRRPLSFLFLILTILLSFAVSNLNNQTLFISYLFPFSGSVLYETSLGYLYLFFYFLLLILIYFAVSYFERL